MLNDIEINTLLLDSVVEQKLIMVRGVLADVNESLQLIPIQDILAVVLISPAIGIALANGKVSIFEELSLEHKLKFLTRRRSLARTDLAFTAFSVVMGGFDDLEDMLYDALKEIVNFSLNKQVEVKELLLKEDLSQMEWNVVAMNAPYFLIKMLKLIFFIDSQSNALEHTVLLIELEKIKSIGQSLELDQMPIFGKFCESFTLKS
ncbi:MAG: hypothetical protein EAZ57_10335 [Cytophagales bacterium]|nr:MAG: hypothetical protein EAZ67_07045 [Cytophagales bacterium]TAF59637.1 MAG: hypothetical protein EAZ57_10335 [Cytophagales bacterium]